MTAQDNIDSSYIFYVEIFLLKDNKNTQDEVRVRESVPHLNMRQVDFPNVGDRQLDQ